MHGAATPSVRTTNTLEAMQALRDAGYLTANEHERLQQAYIFLRHLIDALRIVRGHARDLVLPRLDTEEYIFLARRMGYWGDHATPRQLIRDITYHMQQAAHIYHARFVAPL
jgi:glutamate-ammonia-ligase adenylyltransferase